MCLGDTLAESFPRTLAEDVRVTVEHLNDHHADAVLFLARHATGRADAVAATIDRVGPSAAGIRLLLPHDEEFVDRVGLDPVTDVAGLHDQFRGLLGAARAASPDAPMTTIEHELAAYAEMPTLSTRVATVDDLTPNLRRVVLRGGLVAVEPLGGDAWVSLLVPAPGRSALPPGVRVQALDDLDPASRPQVAAYSVRDVRPDADELELWMVVHDRGVGSWARTAAPGDVAAVTPARRSWEADAGHDHLLAVGDETALPAILGVLAEREPHTTAAVVVEAVDAGHVLDLDVGPDVPVTWAFREGAPPGTTTTLLDAVAAQVLPAGRVAVFGAAEAGVARALRRHARVDRGLDRRDVRVTGYWRRTVPGS